MAGPFVAVLMGSDSDLPVMQACIDTLKKFDSDDSTYQYFLAQLESII